MGFTRNLTKAMCVLTFTLTGWSASGQTLPPRVFTTIDVQGNDRFRDGDILTTSGLQTGVPIGQADLEAAYEALEFTGEFERVELRSVGDTLIILVEEAPEYSGGLTFGAGYDTDTGVFGAAGLLLKDAFGAGSVINGNLLVAEEVQTLRLSAVSPTFWGGSQRGGVRLSFGNYEYDNVTYRYRTAELEPFMSFDLSDATRAELRYTLGTRRVFDIDASASPILHAEEGTRTSSGVGFSFVTGAAPGNVETWRGGDWFLRFDQDFTGLGGDTELSETRLSFGGRQPLSQNGFAIRSRVELGAVVGHGSDQPRVSERYTLGGAGLRGFARGGVSPRDVCSGCGAGGADTVTDLGGNYYAVAQTDILIPLFPQQPQIETFFFLDVGTVWTVDTATPAAGRLDDSQSWRNSLGLGASFDTRLGKFEAYYALDTNGVVHDDVQEFGLTFRSQF